MEDERACINECGFSFQRRNTRSRFRKLSRLWAMALTAAWRPRPREAGGRGACGSGAPGLRAPPPQTRGWRLRLRRESLGG